MDGFEDLILSHLDVLKLFIPLRDNNGYFYCKNMMEKGFKLARYVYRKVM